MTHGTAGAGRGIALSGIALSGIGDGEIGFDEHGHLRRRRPALVCGPILRRVDRGSIVVWVEVAEGFEEATGWHLEARGFCRGVRRRTTVRSSTGERRSQA